MAGKKLIVPFEDNKFYYDGLRGILSGSVYSMLGVYITAWITNDIGIKDFFEFPLVTVHLWIAMCLILWRKSYTTPTNIVLSIGAIWFYPKIANIFLILLYIMIGVLCSLMFEAFGKISISYENLVAVYVSMLLYIFLLFCFSSLSVQIMSEKGGSTLKPEESAK